MNPLDAFFLDLDREIAASPPPVYVSAVLPVVETDEEFEFWERAEAKAKRAKVIGGSFKAEG